MNFQFAKRLEAGRIFVGSSIWELFFNGVCNLICIDANLEGLTCVTYTRCPSLTELIEACGHRELEFRVQNDHSRVRTNDLNDEVEPRYGLRVPPPTKPSQNSGSGSIPRLPLPITHN